MLKHFISCFFLLTISTGGFAQSNDQLTLLPFLKDSVYGYADLDGNVVIEPQYKMASFFGHQKTLKEIHPEARYYREKDKTYGLPKDRALVKTEDGGFLTDKSGALIESYSDYYKRRQEYIAANPPTKKGYRRPTYKKKNKNAYRDKMILKAKAFFPPRVHDGYIVPHYDCLIARKGAADFPLEIYDEDFRLKFDGEIYGLSASGLALIAQVKNPDSEGDSFSYVLLDKNGHPYQMLDGVQFFDDIVTLKFDSDNFVNHSDENVMTIPSPSKTRNIWELEEDEISDELRHFVDSLGYSFDRPPLTNLFRKGGSSFDKTRLYVKHEGSGGSRFLIARGNTVFLDRIADGFVSYNPKKKVVTLMKDSEEVTYNTQEEEHSLYREYFRFTRIYTETEEDSLNHLIHYYNSADQLIHTDTRRKRYGKLAHFFSKKVHPERLSDNRFLLKKKDGFLILDRNGIVLDDIVAHTGITGHRNKKENWVRLSRDKHLRQFSNFLLFRNIPNGGHVRGGNGDYGKAWPFVYDYEELIEYRLH